MKITKIRFAFGRAVALFCPFSLLRDRGVASPFVILNVSPFISSFVPLVFFVSKKILHKLKSRYLLVWAIGR